MTDLTVDGLGELTAPAANDEIGIWDVSAGQFLKIQRSTLVGATITGDGTIALGNYTLTVPATGTAALISSATWTPSIIGATTPGSHTYTIRVGLYVKIGTLVVASFQVSIASKDAAMAGDVMISGLPFASKNTMNLAHSGGIAHWYGLNDTYVYMNAIINQYQTAALIVATSVASAGLGVIASSKITNGSGFVGTLIYLADS